MGVKENRDSKKNSHLPRRMQEVESSDEESNDTLPIPAMEQLSLVERQPKDTVPPDHHEQHEEFLFLKNKPIRKKNKQNIEKKEYEKNKMKKMECRIKELETLLEEYRTKQKACPHCHFYLNSGCIDLQRRTPTPEQSPMFDSFRRSTSKDSLQFEKIDFMTPLMCSPEMEEKSWVFLGTVMIAMGSKVLDMDGTINVFKIVKESVDKIRRQVEKSQKKLSIDFFMGKEEFEGSIKMDQVNFDPFYAKEEPHGGLQLEGVRVESVQQYDLYFDQKLSFNVNYDALITAMEYLKENSNILYS